MGEQHEEAGERGVGGVGGFVSSGVVCGLSFVVGGADSEGVRVSGKAVF